MMLDSHAGIPGQADVCDRATVYIFVGTILLHNHVILEVAGGIIAVTGIGYAVLEFVPQIEPPQNMRDAGGEWGAEQI